MNLFQNNKVNNTSSNIRPNNQPVRKPISGLNQYSSNTNHASMEEGKIVRGEITDLKNNNEITVTLEDSTVITGKLENSSELSIGQTAAFKVNLNGNDMPTLKFLPNSAMLSQDITIQKALEEANLPKNERNQSIVRELLANQLSINKQSILSILQQAISHKEASVGTLVLMNKLQIPITEQSATQFEHYRNFNHQLLAKLEQFTDSLPEFLTGQANSTDSKEAILLCQNLLSQCLTTQESQSKSFTNEVTLNELFHTFLANTDFTDFLELLDQFGLPFEAKEQLLSGSITLKDFYHILQSSMKKAKEFDLTNTQEALAKLQSEHNVTSLSQLDSSLINETLSEVPKTMEAFDLPVLHKVVEEYHLRSKQNMELGSFLSLEERMELTKTLKDFPIHSNVIAQTLTGDIKSNDLMRVINNVLTFTDSKAVAKLFATDSFRQMLKQTILSNWTLTPDKLKEEQALSKLYNKMYEQLNQLSKFLEQAAESEKGNALLSQTNGMKDNIDFMKTLNQMFTYVQLPMRLRNQNLHGDLYVYTKQKNLRSKTGDISVLLHLDFNYLGAMDIHLTMNSKYVNSKFYFEEEETLHFLEPNVELLKAELEQKGYSLNVEMNKRNRKIDLVEDFIKVDLGSSSLKRYTFDIRA